MNVKVSVVIPIYNVDKYLDVCISSIVEQTYKNIEIILIDDGSTDSSGTICDKYSEKYVNVNSIHTNNMGVSNARNLGIKRSTGDYIICIDSDDYIEKDMIDQLIKSMMETQADMAICAIDLFDNVYKTRKKNSIQNFINDKKVVNRNQLYMYAAEAPLEPYFGAPYNKLIKRGLIIKNNLKYETNAIIAEDTCFNFDVYSYVNKVAICNEVLYHHRINAGVSLSRRKHSINDINKRVEAIEEAINKFCDSVQNTSESISKKYKISINTFWIHKITIDCMGVTYKKRAQLLAQNVKANNEILYSGKFEKIIRLKWYLAFVIICNFRKMLASLIKHYVKFEK